MKPTTPNALPDFSNAPQNNTPILERFIYLFKEPQGLPPSWNLSNKINLIHEASPVNVRPQCYPHFQKRKSKNVRLL